MIFGIVTPLLDGRSTFRACAASVQAARAVAPELAVRHLVRESDASAEPCESLARTFNCAYVRAPDSGLYPAIATGLDNAVAGGADILGWLNGDEQLLPDALRRVADAFNTNPALDLVFGDYLIATPDATVLAARREIPARRFLLRNGVNSILSCTTFFRRRVWERFRPFSPDYRLLADKHFYLRLIEDGAVIRHLPQYLGVYGATGKNASLAPLAIAEQARLRAEIGVGTRTPARALARLWRISEKLLRGAYLPLTIEVTLLDGAGRPRPFRGRVGTAWRWQ